jgi:hypothetical protein
VGVSQRLGTRVRGAARRAAGVARARSLAARGAAEAPLPGARSRLRRVRRGRSGGRRGAVRGAAWGDRHAARACPTGSRRDRAARQRQVGRQAGRGGPDRPCKRLSRADRGEPASGGRSQGGRRPNPCQLEPAGGRERLFLEPVDLGLVGPAPSRKRRSPSTRSECRAR